MSILCQANAILRHEIQSNIMILVMAEATKKLCDS